jgi:hypothetical protein
MTLREAAQQALERMKCQCPRCDGSRKAFRHLWQFYAQPLLAVATGVALAFLIWGK